MQLRYAWYRLRLRKVSSQVDSSQSGQRGGGWWGPSPLSSSLLTTRPPLGCRGGTAGSKKANQREFDPGLHVHCASLNLVPGSNILLSDLFICFSLLLLKNAQLWVNFSLTFIFSSSSSGWYSSPNPSPSTPSQPPSRSLQTTGRCRPSACR